MVRFRQIVTGKGDQHEAEGKNQVIRAENNSTISQVVQVAGDYYASSAVAGERDSGTTYNYVPPKSCAQFVGRQNTLDLLMGILRDQKKTPIVAIVGMGGTGKTTLALRAIDYCREERTFDGIAWVSFKTEIFVGEKITSVRVPAYSPDMLVNDIVRQCIVDDISQISPDQRMPRVKELMENKRILIVLDNLETLQNGEAMIDSLFQILGRGTLLITSRRVVKYERAFNIKLEGFPDDEGVAFIIAESKARGIDSVARAEHAHLVTIHNTTGGNPLAMKLVIGQISRQPIQVVLQTLKEASPLGQDYEFFCFLFRRSWELLDLNARMVWVDMAVFPPVVGGTVKDVVAISQVTDRDFWPAMDQLVGLMLVDKIGKIGAERYALHPLSRYFILSDITKELVGTPEGC